MEPKLPEFSEWKECLLLFIMSRFDKPEFMLMSLRAEPLYLSGRPRDERTN